MARSVSSRGLSNEPSDQLTLVDGEAISAVELATARREFTREEYHRMGEVTLAEIFA